MEAIEVLKQSIIDGNILRLPNTQLDRKVYLEVKKKLELIGGTWKGGKVGGFIFKEDPASLIGDIINGKKRNLKKEFQFFATPEILANKLVSLTGAITGNILEPSAGQGAIVKAIRRVNPVIVDCFELMPLNQKILLEVEGVNLIGDDFLLCGTSNYYDLIIANPPFSGNQDIDHILKMYEVCKPGGRIISVASMSWSIGQSKKQKAFKKFLNDVSAEIFYNERGTFKESGTDIATSIIIINKPV